MSAASAAYSSILHSAKTVQITRPLYMVSAPLSYWRKRR